MFQHTEPMNHVNFDEFMQDRLVSRIGKLHGNVFIYSFRSGESCIGM
jgi:hypothetical protein